MKRATTLQFRKAARKVLSKHGVFVSNSWTNGAPKRNRVETGTRTVGFQLGFFGATISPNNLVLKVEKKLAKKGLTASTRFTDPGGYRAGCYLRGTCDYPV